MKKKLFLLICVITLISSNISAEELCAYIKSFNMNSTGDHIINLDTEREILHSSGYYVISWISTLLLKDTPNKKDLLAALLMAKMENWQVKFEINTLNNNEAIISLEAPARPMVILGENFALNKPITDGFPTDVPYKTKNEAYANDGIFDTYCDPIWTGISDVGNTGERVPYCRYLTIDLGEVKKINLVICKFIQEYDDYFPVFIEISKDNNNFEQVGFYNSNNDVIVHSFDTIEARWVRVTYGSVQTGTVDGVREIEVYNAK